MTTPALATHVLSLYKVLEKESKGDVFVGSLTKAYDSVGCSRSYYRRVYAILTDLSCITIEVRGRGSTESVVRLHRPPTMAEVESWDLTRGPHSDKTLLESRVHVLETRLGGIDIKRALFELGESVTNLEAELAKIKKQASTN